MSAAKDSSELENTTFKQYHPSLLLFIHALLFLGLLSRSPLTRVLLFFFILAITTYLFIYTRTDDADQAPWTMLVVTLLQASDALVMNDVAKLRIVGQKKDTNELGVWERTKWALKLMFSLRHIGWTHEPRYVLPPHPTETRRRFIFVRIIHGLGYYALVDALNTYMCHYYVNGKDHITSISEGSVLERMLMMVLHGAYLWWSTSLVYTIFSIGAVATYLTEASEWPALFGNWSDAYTVRRFWGRTWHQIFRRTLSTHANFIAFKLLHLQEGTYLGIIVQCYAAFAISGLFHTAGEYATFRSEYWGIRTGMTFFLLQPTIIMVEQGIAKILRLKAGTWTRRAGYVWVICWFAWAGPAWFDQLSEHWITENDVCRKGVTSYLLGALGGLI